MINNVNIYLKSRNLKKYLNIDKKYIKFIVIFVMQYLGKADNFEVTILLSNDKFIQKYNKEFRKQDKPTNILSFESGDKNYLGDIIISLQTIKKEAVEQGKFEKNHFIHILIHGVLHLLGYDHLNQKDQDEMEDIEIKILASLEIPNPYFID